MRCIALKFSITDSGSVAGGGGGGVLSSIFSVRWAVVEAVIGSLSHGGSNKRGAGVERLGERDKGEDLNPNIYPTIALFCVYMCPSPGRSLRNPPPYAPVTRGRMRAQYPLPHGPFFLLRTALKDRPQGPPTANHQPPSGLTVNGDQLLIANRCQPPPTANRQSPPTANRQSPPTTVVHVVFLQNCRFGTLFSLSLKDRPALPHSSF